MPGHCWIAKASADGGLGLEQEGEAALVPSSCSHLKTVEQPSVCETRRNSHGSCGMGNHPGITDPLGFLC